MATNQQLIDRARYTLKDDDKVRYPDAELLVYLNLALGIIKRRRPDLFFGNFGTPLAELALSDPYPLPPEYQQPMVDYLTGRAQMKNTEAADENVAAAFIGLFDAGLN